MYQTLNKELLLQRQEDIFRIGVYFKPEHSIVTKVSKDIINLFLLLHSSLQIVRDARMKISDKLSWIGGMIGLFTGFSVISGLEIIYWIWFKVLFQKKKVEQKEVKSCKDCQKLRDDYDENMKRIDNELKLLQFKAKSSEFEAGAFFDAIFNDVEAQKSDDN